MVVAKEVKKLQTQSKNIWWHSKQARNKLETKTTRNNNIHSRDITWNDMIISADGRDLSDLNISVCRGGSSRMAALAFPAEEARGAIVLQMCEMLRLPQFKVFRPFLILPPK